jgi:hypothetical protein
MTSRFQAFLTVLIFTIIVLLLVFGAGLLLSEVLKYHKVSGGEIRTVMVVTAKNTCNNFEPALQAQYLNDGTICIIGLGYNAIWIDRFGGRHEVPTEYEVIK